MNQVTELHAWIGITPAGDEHVLYYRGLQLVSDQHSDAETLRPEAEVLLRESKVSTSPLARIELRTFRSTP
jgi:hypothetical protein